MRLRLTDDGRLLVDEWPEVLTHKMLVTLSELRFAGHGVMDPNIENGLAFVFGNGRAEYTWHSGEAPLRLVRAVRTVE